jgi:hypothetical protein
MYDAELENIQITPRGREHLAFSYAKPTTWSSTAFTGRTAVGKFESLVLSVSPRGSALFSVGVLRIPAGGATRPWLASLCREANTEIEATREFAGGYLFNARQNVEGRITIHRKLYIESGGYLFAVCAMAPEPIFAQMELILSSMVESFRLTNASNFPSALGLTLPVPCGWTAADEGPFAVLSQANAGARIRVGRLPHDAAVLDKLHHSYARTNPQADAMFDVVNGVATLVLANVRVSDGANQTGFRVYFVQPIPQEGAMYIAQVTIPEGQFHAAMTTASSVLAVLGLAI